LQSIICFREHFTNRGAVAEGAVRLRQHLGEAEVTVVSDGPLPLGPPKGTFIGASEDEIKKMLTDTFLSPDNPSRW